MSERTIVMAGLVIATLAITPSLGAAQVLCGNCEPDWDANQNPIHTFASGEGRYCDSDEDGHEDKCSGTHAGMCSLHAACFGPADLEVVLDLNTYNSAEVAAFLADFGKFIDPMTGIVSACNGVVVGMVSVAATGEVRVNTFTPKDRL